MADVQSTLFSQLGGETQYGVLLVAQMGGVPNEIQLIVETAAYDAAVEGLRPVADYLIRALGVFEHRLTLGVFAHGVLTQDHPLLLHHNAPRAAVHFDGQPADVHALITDISQAYVSTFLEWRNLVEMPEDLNRALPLVDLLTRGTGLLGTMPLPLAERMARVLEHHGLHASLSQQANFEPRDEHGRSRLAKVLVLDSSYVVSLDFSFERLGQGRA
jgi:hypothetical protein